MLAGLLGKRIGRRETLSMLKGGVLRIAYIGWGSLVWAPKELPCGSWLEDGPQLPVEFGRTSRDGRVSLVLFPGKPLVTTLWSLSSLSSVDDALAALSAREGGPFKHGCGVASWRRGEPWPPTHLGWARAHDLDAVLWTSLQPKMGDVYCRPTYQDIRGHLNGLAPAALANAGEYVRRAPRQIDTEYRRRLVADFGWTSSEGGVNRMPEVEKELLRVRAYRKKGVAGLYLKGDGLEDAWRSLGLKSQRQGGYGDGGTNSWKIERAGDSTERSTVSYFGTDSSSVEERLQQTFGREPLTLGDNGYTGRWTFSNERIENGGSVYCWPCRLLGVDAGVTFTAREGVWVSDMALEAMAKLMQKGVAAVYKDSLMDFECSSVLKIRMTLEDSVEVPREPVMQVLASVR